MMTILVVQSGFNSNPQGARKILTLMDQFPDLSVLEFDAHTLLKMFEADGTLRDLCGRLSRLTEKRETLGIEATTHILDLCRKQLHGKYDLLIVRDLIYTEQEVEVWVKEFSRPEDSDADPSGKVFILFEDQPIPTGDEESKHHDLRSCCIRLAEMHDVSSGLGMLSAKLSHTFEQISVVAHKQEEELV